jgi:hypothetical protein
MISHRAIAGAVVWMAVPATAQQPSVEAIRGKELKTLGQFFNGTFTNEEQVYFQEETGSKKDPRATIRVTAKADGMASVEFTDSEGKLLFPEIPVTLSVQTDGVQITSKTCSNHYTYLAERFTLDEKQSRCSWKGARFVSISNAGVVMREADGRLIDYRRARPYTCWVSVPKAQKKADGSTDWTYFGGQKLHDQGGRFWVPTDDSVPQKFGFKLRNVVWPYGNNKPALTLYVYKSDAPDKAASYSWADPEAKLIGINLRWLQGSCSRD